MAVTGEIAASAKSELPLTWAALEADERYGDAFLLRKVNQVKYRLFGAVVDASFEAALVPVVTEYAGKLAAISVCPGAADYWASQQIIRSTDGGTSTTFIDRRAAIWELQEKLVAEAGALRPDVEAILGPLGRLTTAKPRIGVSDQESTKSVTQQPFDFERTFARPGATTVAG